MNKYIVFVAFALAFFAGCNSKKTNNISSESQNDTTTVTKKELTDDNDYRLEGLAKAVSNYTCVTEPFKEGLAVVLLDCDGNHKYGYIDKEGKEVIPFIYDHASSFNEGLARVEKNGKFGYIDKTGKLVIPYQWNDASSFRDGMAEVKDADDKTYFIDKTGKVVQ